MSFVKKILSPDDGSAKRAAQAAQEAERSKLAEARRLEGIETKKAQELAVKTQGQQKRRLRRRGGSASTTFGPALGRSGGGAIDSKVLLGL